MKTIICFVMMVVFLPVFAQDSFDVVFAEWAKYHATQGALGHSSQEVNHVIHLIVKKKSTEAREYLRAIWPQNVEEVLQLIEQIIKKMPIRVVLSSGFSLTEHVFDQQHRQTEGRPYSQKEIYGHIAEAIFESCVAGESIVLGAPLAAIAVGMSAVHNFREAARKYCENVKHDESSQESDNSSQNLYDRTFDSAVR